MSHVERSLGSGELAAALDEGRAMTFNHALTLAHGGFSSTEHER
jgi:hypothetical protein